MKANVKFALHLTYDQKQVVINDIGGTLVFVPSYEPLSHICVIDLPENQMAAAQLLNAIDTITKDGTFRTTELDIDAVFSKDYSRNWGIQRVNGAQAHAVNKGAGVTVAVLDTGKVDHPDLVEKGHFNARDPEVDQPDAHGHSSHVFGILAAQINEIGVVGAAPEASVYTVAVLDDNGVGQWSDIIVALDWCGQKGIQITSNSYSGSTHPGAEVEEAFRITAEAGMIHVCSAGNSNGGAVGYPARFPFCVAVSSTDEDDGSSSFSSIGEEVRCSAPGRGIYSTYKNNTYATLSGTSMSCPLVSGIFALMLSAGIADPIGQLPKIVDDLGDSGRDIRFGWGLPMADRAVDAPINPVFGRDVLIDASESTDEDGSIAEYWFKSGDTSEWHMQRAGAPIREYTYAADGIYKVEVVVKDNGGAFSTIPHWNQTIEVKTDDSGENTPPVTRVEIRNQ